MIAATIVPLVGADGDPGRAVALASVLALLVGAITALVGIARLGFIADLISRPTILGYMNGLALTILIGQLPKLFGFSVDGEASSTSSPDSSRGSSPATRWEQHSPSGWGRCASMLVLERVVPKIPSVLAAVVAPRPPDDGGLRGDGGLQRRHVALRDVLGGDRSDPGSTTTTGRPRTRSSVRRRATTSERCRSSPRPRPGWSRSTATAATAASAPPFAPRKPARRSAHGGRSSATRSSATAPAVSSGRRTRRFRSCRSASGRSGTSRTRRASSSRSRTSTPTPSCSHAAHGAITRRRPGRRDHPRRHVRDATRRPQAGDLGLGLPSPGSTDVKGAKKHFDGVAPAPVRRQAAPRC